ncbi:hypothetical protein D9M71_646370 [compost metagenome]
MDNYIVSAFIVTPERKRAAGESAAPRFPPLPPQSSITAHSIPADLVVAAATIHASDLSRAFGQTLVTAQGLIHCHALLRRFCA